MLLSGATWTLGLHLCLLRCLLLFPDELLTPLLVSSLSLSRLRSESLSLSVTSLLSLSRPLFLSLTILSLSCLAGGHPQYVQRTWPGIETN